MKVILTLSYETNISAALCFYRFQNYCVIQHRYFPICFPLEFYACFLRKKLNDQERVGGGADLKEYFW